VDNTIESALASFSSGSSLVSNTNCIGNTMSSMPNPFFLEFGAIIDEGFIGRRAALERLSSRVISSAPGNFSIVGMRRIGKSSLAYQGIIQRRDELIERRVLPIWISFSLYDTPTDFFRSLVVECYRGLLSLEWATPAIGTAYQEVTVSAISGALRSDSIPDPMRSAVQQFFQQIRRQKIRPLFVIDEFDDSIRLFQENPTNFQRLRDLHNNVSSRVSFVTTSVRPIKDIEITCSGISTVAGIFERYDLGVFDNADLNEYFARFQTAGIELTEEQKSRIIFYCGGHPLLLVHLGHEIVEMYHHRQAVDVDAAAHEKQTLFSEQYDSIIKRLRKDGHYYELLQALGYGASPSSATSRSLGSVEITDHLMKQGLLHYGPIPRSLSEHFQGYLLSQNREPQPEMTTLLKTDVPLNADSSRIAPPDLESATPTQRSVAPLQLPQERRRELREFIDQRFGLTDIRTICFDFGIDFENLVGGGKKIEALINHMDHRRGLKELLIRLRDDRPEFFAASGLAQLLVLEATHQ
jgi:hypothetical protein